jgi:ABC-type transporter Mla subunit MlaD
VTVRIKIDNDIRLPADTRAVARADVFGTHSVELLPGEALVALEGGDTIQGMTQQPLTLATELGGQARGIMASADSLLSPRAVSDLQATAAELPERRPAAPGRFQRAVAGRCLPPPHRRGDGARGGRRRHG